jgi:hypothetical protein
MRGSRPLVSKSTMARGRSEKRIVRLSYRADILAASSLRRCAVIGDFKPRDSWSDDERRMHLFIPKLVGLALGAIVLIGAVVVAVLFVAC